ncbi:Retrovirus-related Pol polyprotein from transposon TNT 1-94 [Porphyridium purpureum]|uniref:Gag-Pol-p199 n=1 Tax=Porphyridium purpureum TaxID=35688 RepID=A0A5J4YKB4_PORPP|nr:Retrovirus-related Pol polyprotein from transposon TNT 1-94 [Porphyridium purpureum]KAA8500082.1 Retrovirus-related Pol polyprotein from transposon TNT 1-94 [Porphyridium purpureum]|eukprot:POR3120..scf244_11
MEPPVMGVVEGVAHEGARSRLFYKHGKVSGSKIDFLIDSGASHNFLGSRFLDASVKSSCDECMVELAGGQRMKVHGPIVLAVDLGFWIGNVEFYIGPIRMDAILGWKWLKMVNPKIDWQKGLMETRPEGKEICTLENVEEVVPELDGKNQSVAASEHELTHMPMQRDCETCVVAKIKRRPARRLEKDVSALSFNDEVGIDLVEPGRNVKSVDGSKFILTHIDRATGWVTLAGLRAKTHTAVADAWKSVQAGRGWPKVLRTDDGNEFKGDVGRLVREHLIKHEVGIPYRPNSHAEQERFHHTLNQGIRANLVQAGLGKRWFMHAAQHFAFMTNRLHVGRKSGKTPFELRRGEKWSPRNLSLPFGCKVVYKDDQPDNKYAPRGKVGILVGVGEHPMAILVLPRDDWTSETPKVIRTQDFKAFTHEFPLKGIEREMVSLSQQEELPEVDEPSAVEAVQDLDRRIDALRAREAELEKEIEALKVRVVDEERAAGTGGPVTIPQLNLTTLLKTGAALASEQGRAAMEKEVKSMLRFGVWDENPLTLEEARRQPGARFVRTHFIFGLKFAEMPEEFRKVKCRLVAGGNRIWGSDGAATNDIFDYETPAGLSAIRMIIAVAAILGLQIVSFDISSAYLHADLSGPPTFAYLPREICDSKDTVVRLRKALYGLPRSGSDFSQDARRRLQKFQWKLVHGEKNVYVRRNAASSSVALLALYVDDGLLACREEERPGIIEELKQEFLIEKAPELLTEGGSLRFLGTSISLKNGSVSLANQEYQDVVIREFEQDIRRVLRAVKSPSEKLDGEEVLNYQVIWKTLKVREHVGRLMWLARTVRPDIAYAVGMIARYVDKWNVAAERLLVRVVQYLKTPREALEYHVLGNLKEGIRMVNILGYTDADFAGCPESRVSTSGRATYLVAGDYKYLVDWSSRKQRFVSSSTSESELAALEETVQLSLFPALSFLRSIRDGEFSVILMCDNQAVMRAIEMGYSPKLHHMAITRATDLAWLHQVCEKQKLVKLAFGFEYKTLESSMMKDCSRSVMISDLRNVCHCRFVWPCAKVKGRPKLLDSFLTRPPGHFPDTWPAVVASCGTNQNLWWKFVLLEKFVLPSLLERARTKGIKGRRGKLVPRNFQVKVEEEVRANRIKRELVSWIEAVVGRLGLDLRERHASVLCERISVWSVFKKAAGV